MLFKCQHCTAPVLPGVEVCNRPLCRQRERERQTNLKCREFGMPPYYREARPFPRAGSP